MTEPRTATNASKPKQTRAARIPCRGGFNFVCRSVPGGTSAGTARVSSGRAGSGPDARPNRLRRSRRNTETNPATAAAARERDPMTELRRSDRPAQHRPPEESQA